LPTSIYFPKKRDQFPFAFLISHVALTRDKQLFVRVPLYLTDNTRKTRIEQFTECNSIECQCQPPYKIVNGKCMLAGCSKGEKCPSGAECITIAGGVSYCACPKGYTTKSDGSCEGTFHDKIAVDYGRSPIFMGEFLLLWKRNDVFVYPIDSDCQFVRRHKRVYRGTSGLRLRCRMHQSAGFSSVRVSARIRRRPV